MNITGEEAEVAGVEDGMITDLTKQESWPCRCLVGIEPDKMQGQTW